MGNKQKKEKHKNKNIENNDKNFHRGKKFSGKNYNIKKENQKNQKMELKEERELKYLLSKDSIIHPNIIKFRNSIIENQL